MLERYVMGKVTEQEAREVERYAREYPEIRAELGAIEETLEAYAHLHASPVSEGFEAGLMERIGRSDSGSSTGSGRNWSRRFWPRMLAAAVIGGLIVGAAYYYAYHRSMQEQLAVVQDELEQLRTTCERTTQQVYALRDPGTERVRMAGLDIAPEALTVVYWNPEQRSSFIDIVQLPQPPEGKQYQLWAIVEGQPTDMGVLPIASQGDVLIDVPFVENPEAFAITLEDEGGSEVPTLDQMYVVGNV
ncbi:MAG: anti-sigma factor [Saprospiraceae bacterium]|nr:anti-sigma factor [Saprospiraceae bacterium]